MEEQVYTARLQASLRARGESLDEVRPLFGGACQDNHLVTTTTGERYVLRSDAPTHLPGSLNRRLESEVIGLAVAGGVPTPPILEVFPDLFREGATAVLMPFVQGVAIGAKVVRMREVHPTLIVQLARALAAIHAVTPGPDPTVRPDNPQDALDGDAVAGALRFMRTMLDVLAPRPACERLFSWLDANRPPNDPVVLVHGDYRVGNFLVDGSGLRAVLDWEFAHWGSPAEDLAWLTVRDWRFGRLDQAVGGIGSRADFLGAYRAAGGTPPPPATLLWWEVLGNLRWATGALFQTVRVLEGGATDLELLAIGRRAVEMEWEGLRRAGLLFGEVAS